MHVHDSITWLTTIPSPINIKQLKGNFSHTKHQGERKFVTNIMRAATTGTRLNRRCLPVTDHSSLNPPNPCTVMIKKIPSSGHRVPSSTWFENHLGLTAGIGSIVNAMLLPGTAAMMARVVLRPWSFSMKVLPMTTAMLTRLILGSIFVMVTTVIAHGGGMRLKLVTVAAAMMAGMVFAPRQLI